MLATLATHWPQILAIISVVMATVGIVHAVMTKEDVRAATGWVGVMVLSPILGVLIYAVAGINRIRRATITAQRPFADGVVSAKHERDVAVEEALIVERYGQRFTGLRTLGDRVARRALNPGNAIDVLETGDEAYAAMCAAIDGAERSVLLETYIFDNDAVGLLFVEALAGAVDRRAHGGIG
ncbi:cardiolipin synthase, partial [Mesorhizobium sp. M7A.F.Ca.CA.002.15.2.1]